MVQKLLHYHKNSVRKSLSIGKDEFSFTPNTIELHRELIEQFYERSVEQYGIGSEQARMLVRLLSGPNP